MSGQDRSEPSITIELPSFAPGFGHAVGVHHDDVAQLELDRDIGEPGGFENADKRTHAAKGDRRACWADQEGERVAATTDSRGPASGLVAKSQDSKRAEAFGVVVEQHFVEGAKAAGGLWLADGGRPVV
jgi:hypothetical protein